ncbi:DUF192 domain-containing protein [Tropicibacter oceani]|uniref:DUF192 domain-containing protein n=1 Tax=Tropicibacter oceani TaxID=3058420 RepID=A0ABY8QE63_9RHOB|nr:DUF192 domain-containing protein [Tropicibacter oceani]WGW02924.1 DUF192 domain-containing protein [Tropicibacter oceani]
MGSRLGALTLAWGLALGATPGFAAVLCDDGAVWLRGDFGKVRFGVDVADDAAERARGLMFVEDMPSSRGMLFVYPSAQPVAFWMKNTLIGLDMIFADETGVVQKVHANAIPGDLTAIEGGGDIRYVLEINGGLAAQMGIQPGAQLRHPAIEGAAWPCE